MRARVRYLGLFCADDAGVHTQLAALQRAHARQRGGSRHRHEPRRGPERCGQAHRGGAPAGRCAGGQRALRLLMQRRPTHAGMVTAVCPRQCLCARGSEVVDLAMQQCAMPGGATVSILTGSQQHHVCATSSRSAPGPRCVLRGSRSAARITLAGEDEKKRGGCSSSIDLLVTFAIALQRCQDRRAW